MTIENVAFRFEIGNFNCMVIRDADDGNRNTLLIQTGQQQILIDTGIGHDLFPPSPHLGLLMDRLLAAGIVPAEIDLVLLSHADFDHICGAVDQSGHPAFPSARYIVSREEYGYWSARPKRLIPSAKFAGFLTENLCQLCCDLPPKRLAQLNNRLELIDPGSEIAPGIRAIAAPGHTPGHMAINISSGDEQMRFVGDLIYDPDDIWNIEWHSAVDVDPAQAAATREQLLGQAASDQTLLIAYHAPFPGLGYVSRQGLGWKWTAYKSDTDFL